MMVMWMRMMLIRTQIFSKNRLNIWVFCQFRRSSMTTKIILMQTDHSRRVFIDQTKIMWYQDNGQFWKTFFGFSNDLIKIFFSNHIDSSRWFIEYEQFWFTQHSIGNEDFLKFSSREGMYIFIEQCWYIKYFIHRIHSLLWYVFIKDIKKFWYQKREALFEFQFLRDIRDTLGMCNDFSWIFCFDTGNYFE